ncbi:amino acid adenylation domain-containing protein [Kitasatospora sp. NPDC001660]
MPAPSGPRAARVSQIPLSVGQEAMWLGWKLDPGQWSHIIPTPFRVTGTLDGDRLRQAVAAVGRAYPQLRARVVETPDGPCLNWAEAPPITVTEHAVTGALESEVRRVWQRPFDLRHGPLARVDVLRGPDWTVLLLAVHHLVFDGASILVLLDRLRSAYAGQPLEEPDHAPALAAFAARSRELADTPAGDAHRAYWRDVLAVRPPVLDLPESVDGPGYAVLDTAVPPELARRLRDRARELGVSYVATLFGAYFVLLRRHCGQDDLLASIPFHGRTDRAGRRDPALSETVGYFVNALPVRCRVRNGDSLADVVRAVGADLRTAAGHGDLPLPAILREAGLTGWEARAHTHGTVFQYWHAGLREDVDVQDLRLRGADVGGHGADECSASLLGMESSADYTLAVMVREDSAGTHVLWKDPAGAVGPTMLRMLADDYLAVLAAVAEDADTGVAEFTDRVATAQGPVAPSRVAALLEALPAVRRAVVTPTAAGADLHVRLTPEGQVTAADALAAVRAGLGDRAPRIRVTVVQAPAAGSSPATGPRQEPPTPALAAMTELWEEVLGIDGIEPDDSFFELGGHSLIAESLVIAVSRRLGREVAVRALFEYPRLRDFADQLGLHDAPSETGEAPIPPSAGTPDDASFPASGFQQRIWLAERIDPGAASYNVPLAWRIQGGRVDLGTLARALELLVARHEILRTRFVEHDGVLRQHVEDVWHPRPDHIDLRDSPDAEADLCQWLNRAADQSFDPAAGRLLTAALLEIGEAAGQVLFVCLHHLVWDGESAGVFLRELSSCYDEAARDEAGPRDEAVAAADVVDDRGGPETHAVSAHQERIGFIDQFEKGTVYPTAPVYHNLPLFLRLDGAVDPVRLRNAVDQVVAAHEALRTGLKETAGRITQVIHPRARVEPRWFDARPDQSGTVPQSLRSWAMEPFALDSPSLLRVAAQPSPEGILWLALVGHQAVVDRAALLVVGEDLLTALDGGAIAGSSYRRWLAEQSPDERTRDLDVRAASLSGAVEPVRLPERRPRKPVHVYEEHAVDVRLPESQPLSDFADLHGLTREDVLLAAFAALLAWYSGQQEMVVGVAHHARRDADRRVVGPLANLLPLRLRPAADTSFRTLAVHVAAELATARRHDRAPFDELVRRLDPAKDMSRTALFDTLFTWAEPSALLPTATELGAGHGKYDLHLFLRPEGETGAAGSLIFNGLYFDDAQIQLMAEHYALLLRAVLDAPDRPVGDAEPLTDRERHSQLQVWNDTGADYRATTLHTLLRERAEHQPAATALTDLTVGAPAHHRYRELLERAEVLARGLVARGVRPGELVALLLPRGAAQVEAMIAVLLAGAAYLPLNPALPDERKEFIFADSGTRWAVVPDGSTADVPAAFTGETLTPAGLAAADDPSTVLPDTAPDSPAYCIYTSGTTGRPKGVVISHRNVVRLIANDRFPFSFGPSDVWTMSHSYAFDFSVWELFCGLAHGGRVVLVSEADVRDPHRFWQLLRRERVTVLNQTPTAFRELLTAERDEPAALDHLRYVIFGGEPLPPALLAPWTDVHPHVRLVNMYGITETTVHVTARTVTRADIDAGRSVIGTPIPTTTVHLLDPNTGRRLLPVGAVGEIHVGGAGVAEGYLNRPDLTAERFVANPHGAGTLFRSGDLGRYRPDGTIEFLGRADSQVQVRGHRVEPGEIETVLREHPAVADAAVVMEDDRLVGYVLPHGKPPRAAEFRAHLRASLPEYMVPGPLRAVDALPLTANGKLDHQALRAAAIPLDTSEGRAPTTPTADAVAELWAVLLDVGRVGADDSFFALGGHSLLAVRMLRQIGSQLGVTLPLRQLFENPRLQDFADLVDAERATTPQITRAAPDTAAAPPASGFQERIWLAERFAQDSAYTIVCAWHAPAGLDHALLQRALGLLVARHEILRTAFIEQDGRLRQHAGAPWTPQPESLDLRRDADPDAGLRAWSREQAAAPFDPASGRLLRAALADLGERGHALLLCFHHLVIDGESIPTLLTDLQLCYRAAQDGTRPSQVVAQYREFSAAQEAQRGGGRHTADLAYWDRHLAGAPAHARLAAPRVAEPHGAIVLDLPADLTERLGPVQREHGVSWFVIAASVLAVALHRTTGSGDLTIGVPFSLPDRSRFPGLIGPCLNTVVLRSRPAAGATLLDLLTAMRTETLDARQHGGAPFEEVVERLNPAREPGRAPYTDITLNMNLLDGRTTQLGDGRLAPLVLDPIGQHETKFAITVTLVEEHGRLSGVLAYRGDLVAATAARRLAQAVSGLLADLPSALRQPVVLADRSATPDPAHRDSVQYRDYVAAQACAHDTLRRAEDLAYWSDHLAEAPQYTDFAAPDVPGPNGTVTVPLPPDLTARLRSVQQDRNCTLYQIAATALAAVLHRWTGREDVVFATPLAHRDDPRFADLLGPCLNTVVLRSRPAADATLLDLLTAMRTETLDAHQHGGAPFEEVVERLNPVRRPGRTPYADVTLSLETAPAEPPRLAGHPLVRLPLVSDSAGYLGKLGITVVLSLTGDALTGTVAYRGDRIRRSDAEQLAALLGRVLAALPAALGTRLDALDLLGDDPEEEARLRAWESGGEPAPATTVPALLHRWIRRTPDAPAVETGHGVLTYRALHDRALTLAARLRPLRPATDPVVALLLGRGEELIVAMLATWYAGAAFCPIDPATPPERVDELLADLQACAVITTDSAAAARLTAAGATVLGVPGTAGPMPDPDTAPIPVAPQDAAYVIYTSGTTGRPKGVMVRHRGLAQLALWGQDSFGLGPADRTGQLLGAAFDATQWDVWSALTSGGCVVPHEGAVEATGLARWLDDRRISVALLATPLAETLWAADPELPHLRWMLVGAAPLTRTPPPRTTYRVRNAYGPTESTVIALTHDLHSDAKGPLNTLGRPVTGTDVLVLDPYGRRCPAGVAGEIYISGAGVAAGYWRLPELTAERFCPAPEAPGEPVSTPAVRYRTGDRGRRQTDGTIEYLGRIDRQLKIRGYRIEPGEIEAALLRHSAVAAAVVHGDPHRTPSLTAYLVPEQGGATRPSVAEVLEGLGSLLPAHLVPEAVVWLAELPLNPSGKVDPSRLPQPGRADLPVAADRVVPRDDLEREIAQAWTDVLGLTEVGIHDNFFDLGGNSLSLAKLHHRLAQRTAPRLSLTALFEHASIAALARFLTDSAGDTAVAPTDALRDRAARARRAAARQAATGRPKAARN